MLQQCKNGIFKFFKDVFAPEVEALYVRINSGLLLLEVNVFRMVNINGIVFVINVYITFSMKSRRI